MKKMDYTIGFQAGRAGQKWTATALTDRAKERTAEPVTFASHPEALAFLKDSQAEGYRFSGAELVDPGQKLVKNRYFVIGNDGKLTPAGEDNGPRNTVWEGGDVMPGSGGNAGTEAVIENILQGPGVRERFGCDLAFLLRVHRVLPGPLAVPIPPFDPAKRCPCGLHGKPYGDCCRDKGIHALGNEMLRGTAPRAVPGALAQIQSSVVQGDTRFRFVWNTLWHRPQTEPFDQFLDALVYATLGRDWFDEQAQRPAAKRHAVARWRDAMVELLKKPPVIDDGFHVGHTLTGPVKAYQCFAYDLYWLQLFHKLPESLIERLKDFHGFQGARYEVLIAAVFARAAFDIEWIDDDTAEGKHPEFIATHKASGKRVGVEAKSRKRSGAVNFLGGEVKPETHLKGDVFDLYEKAVQQSPEGGIPFLIFIDANVPDSPPHGLPSYDHIPIETAPWMVEIRDRLLSIWEEATGQTPESAVMITNFAFYYGDNENPSPTGMGAFFPSLNPRVPILGDPGGDPMIADLIYCLQTYDTVPRQI
jgi:hypothetical protein